MARKVPLSEDGQESKEDVQEEGGKVVLALQNSFGPEIGRTLNFIEVGCVVKGAAVFTCAVTKVIASIERRSRVFLLKGGAQNFRKNSDASEAARGNVLVCLLFNSSVVSRRVKVNKTKQEIRGAEIVGPLDV